MENKTIGFAFCGSMCTYEKTFAALMQVKAAYEQVIPIFSLASQSTDSRFGLAAEHMARAEKITGHPVLKTISDVEPLGPKKLLDLLVIAPCTGNTLAKLSHGIADGPVTMAAKSHLRNGRPVLLAISTNDGLSTAAENIGRLLARKHYYFVPFRQDDPIGKPTSLVAEPELLTPAIAAALSGKQLQPVLLGS